MSMYSAVIVVAVRIIWVPIDMPGQIITVVVGVCASIAVTSTP